MIAIEANKFAPALADYYLGRTGFDSQQTKEPVRRTGRTICSNRCPAISARMAYSGGRRMRRPRRRGSRNTKGTAALAGALSSAQSPSRSRDEHRRERKSEGNRMAKTTADLLVERLIEWGVDTIFGFPGDGINGIFEALRTNQEKIRFIQVRHEEAAAFAACGYAKYTGRLGVCLATSGPGGIHLLNGLYDAKCDGQPVLGDHRAYIP